MAETTVSMGATVSPIPRSRQDKIEEQILDESLRIEFFTTELTLELVAQKLDNKEMYVPDYQRQFNWNQRTRSRFIESLLLRLPIPFLFFWEAEDAKLEIVDGSQRIRTIWSFLVDDMRLGDLDRLTTSSGVTFSDLPENVKRRFKNTTIRGIVMGRSADLEARRDLFNRINTSALQATPAEIRRGVNSGPFLELVMELSAEPAFKHIAPMTEIDENRRLDEELISRFFAYSGDLTDYRDNVREYIAQFTDKQNRSLIDDPRLYDSMRNDFRAAVKFVDRVFPYGVRKNPKGKKTYSARFEAIVVGSHLAIRQDPTLAKRKPDVTRWLNSDEFNEVVRTDAANVRSKLLARIHFVRNRLLES